MSPVQIERLMCQHGGKYLLNGKIYGNGALFHLKKYWETLWPEDSQTWWTDLIMSTVIDNVFTSVVGPASSWKSSTVGRMALMDWSLYPSCTSVIMSSTTKEGVRSRIFGEVTMLWKRAKERHAWFPGFPVDSQTVITEANVEEERARDIRNSILGLATKNSSGTFVGYGSYAGRKNRRVWCIGDEFQWMTLAVLGAQDNLISNDDGSGIFGGVYPPDHADPYERGKPRRHYRCVFVGNTNPSVRDNPLDIVSEPEAGWNSIEEATEEKGKTQVWQCKQHPKHPVKCVCVNLDGMDSPNSPYPVDKPRWPHLAGPHKLKKYLPGSESYWSNGRGRFKFGLDQFKIITRDVCEQFHAFDDCHWDGPPTKIGALDAAYGGNDADRCALGWFEFGNCPDGKMRLKFRELWLVPVTIRNDMIPEDQISLFCKTKMEQVGVLPTHFFFDGRGTLAVSLARIWSPEVNVLEFGGSCTNRPAGPDLFIEDKATGLRRLQTAEEAFSKFVSELWFSTRYVVESDQMRGISMDIVLDAQPREWRKVRGDRKEIETKKELKERTGISPDLADMWVTGVEGARRKGFAISNLGAVSGGPSQLDKWLKRQEKSLSQLNKSFQLSSFE
mgnify:FL=1